MPKITVILPIYNVEKYLSQCLDSIVNQTFKDFECICVNDGSTDNSLSILKEYASKDNRIKIINQEHKEASAARNAGLKNTCCQYITFVDSDDWVDKNYLQFLYEVIEKNDSDVVACNYEEYHEKENKFVPNILPQERKLCSNDKYSVRIGKAYAQPTVWNKIIKTKFLKDNDIKFFEGFFACEDSPFIALIFIFLKKITYIEDILYFYRRQRKTSLSSNKEKLFIGKVHNFIKLIEDIINRDMFNNDIFCYTYKLLFWDLSSFCRKNYSDDERQKVLDSTLKLIKQIENNKDKLSFKNILKLKTLKFILVNFKVKSYKIIRILKNFIF